MHWERILSDVHTNIVRGCPDSWEDSKLYFHCLSWHREYVDKSWYLNCILNIPLELVSCQGLRHKAAEQNPWTVSVAFYILFILPGKRDDLILERESIVPLKMPHLPSLYFFCLFQTFIVMIVVILVDVDVQTTQVFGFTSNISTCLI